MLGDRSQQIDRLFVNSNTLLAAFNERSRAISALLSNVSAFSAQVQNLINDNPNLNHVLEQLRTVSDLLVARKDDLAQAVTMLGKTIAGLQRNCRVGTVLQGVAGQPLLTPYWILQPWVDAAFKKRGLDPEDFWRSAGLPAFRFPDPNGTRFPNGAPPPAPPVLEGTPDHPGPAVAPGSPCSYAPTPELLPRPGNPMPCAGIDQDQGPFGPNGPYPALPDVALVAAEPQRPAPDTRDPDRRAAGQLRRQTCRAHRCRSRRGRPGRAPSRWDPPVRFRRRRRSRRGCRLDRRRRRGLETSFRLRSSRRATGGNSRPGSGERREVTRIEHRL